MDIESHKGLEFTKEIDSSNSAPYKACGSLDLEGNLTITGNLTVQQSQWVYLKGPITSSRILVNGPITASGVWVKGDIHIGENRELLDTNPYQTINLLEQRLDRLERAFIEHINSINTRLGGN
jgi:hypothetical protein